MPRAGGPSTITGIDFEAWFVALKFADAFFDESLRVSPQAQTYTDPKTLQTEITAMDDIHVTSPLISEFYNLKFRAPNIVSWGLMDLRHSKVLLQLKEQFLKTPEAKLYFVSQSPCPLFQEVLPRGSFCSSKEELMIILGPNNYVADWDKLREELGFSDEAMIGFSRQVTYKHIIDTEEIRKLILQKFEGHVTNSGFVPNCLYQLAIEAGKKGIVIDKDHIIKHLERNDIHAKPHLKPELLLERLSDESATLKSISNTFLKDCHINRKEIRQLLDWLNAPLSENKTPIAVLTGKAGCGKSVIFRDLLENLGNENIPVLGIKTDLYMKDSIQLLSRELNLVDGIKETLASIVERFGRAVILLDQIDTLSQTLSTDRKIINTYVNLISQLSLVKNLRIIISCRTFDLKYDPLLRSFEDKCTIEVSDLNEEEISFVLSKLGVEKSRISKTLMELFKIPLRLKVFCDIYKEGINLNSLKTLQDLYDSLWDQRILSATNNTPVLDAIETVTRKMDESKSTSVVFALLDKNDVGRRHLLSQSILIRQKNMLQFFHQSFFDYCYSRTFLTHYDSLIGILLQQHQGLFIRPQIKQVLTHLRGSEFQKYLKELKELLTNKSIRFHIWLLVVNQLAFLEDPTDEEWQAIKPLLDRDPNFRMHFIDGLQSEQWLKYLINKGYLHSFLESSDSELINLIAWKLSVLINIFTETIIDFLSGFPEINKRDEYICNVLIRLDHWENDKAVQVFGDKLKVLKNSPGRYSYYHILGKLLPYKPEVVSKIFFIDLSERLNVVGLQEDFGRNFCDYHDVAIFKKILMWNEDIALSEGLSTVSELAERTKHEGKYNFYDDKAFGAFGHFERDLYEHWKFLTLITEKLESIAQNDKVRFLKLVSRIEETNSITLLRLLIVGFLANPGMYVKEGFKLLTREGILEELTSDEYAGHELRSLLNNLYRFLSAEEKGLINNLILSVAPDWEKDRWKGGPSRAGYSRYRLLCAIPKDELVNYPSMKKDFHELERKFGRYEEKPPKVSKVVSVGPPLEGKAYEKMTPAQWIASFKRYDDSTGWNGQRREFLKGGLVEHSRAFTEQVSKRPDEFYDFIFSLGKRTDISVAYLAAGLDGLVKAKFDIEKVKKLVKEYWKAKDSGFRREIIRAMDYLDKEDNLDLELISILEEYALKDPDPDKELWMVDAGRGTPYYGGDPLTHGINTVRGAAAERLAIHGFKTPYPDKIFEIMEEVTNDPSVSVRCCLIRFLQGMLKWDREKTFSIFMKLGEEKHPQIIKYGLECLSYLMRENNFHHFIPYLRIAMGIDEEYGYHHVGEYVGQILMLAYGEGYSNSKNLLEQGILASDKIKAGAINFACRHLLNQNEEVSRKSK